MSESELKVFTDMDEMLTLEGAWAKGARKVNEVDLGLVSSAAMVCHQGRIVWVGRTQDFQKKILQTWGDPKSAEFHSFKGQTVLPAFVEPHTHLIFAGDRSHEMEWRIQGQTYQEIANQGGGIRFTVQQTRAATMEELRGLGQERADRFLRQGVTTLEVKSGYGLDVETECRCLQVAHQIQGPRVVTTYLGAHSRSPDFPDLDSYLTMMCQEVMPRLKREGLANRVDIYVEQGFFGARQAERYYERARELGLELTGHLDQLSDTGFAEKALDYAPKSLDHLVFASDALINKLSQSTTTAVLLPTSDFYLRMQYPRARQMIDSGVRVALSTDFNPGTSPTQDLSFVGVLARLEMRMTLPEVLVAYTLGGAFALGRESQLGSLSVGKCCDFLVLDRPWRELFTVSGGIPCRLCLRTVTVSGRSRKQNN